MNKKRTRSINVFFHFVIVIVATTSAQDSQAATTRPNIVLILADDLGYGELSCFGGKLVATPHLDRVAAEGAKFTQFYAGCTVCAPSRSVLMTGLHTGHTRVRGNAGLDDRTPQNLRAEDVTLAEVLREAGYATALIGKWGLGHEGSPGVPTQQGFDYFYGYLDQVHAHNPYPPFLLRGTERVALRNRTVPGTGGSGESVGAGIADPAVDYAPDLMTAEALSWVEKQQKRPFFLYWSLISPHANNAGTKHGRGQEVPDRGEYASRDWPVADKGHAALIARLDADVGRLLERLKQLGLDDNTLILFSSDNGPHKEGGNNPALFKPAGPWSGLKRDLTDGGIRVPTVARWPGRIRPGTVVATPLWFADVLPTFAELSGAELSKPVDGRSFAQPLVGTATDWPSSRSLYWEFHEKGFSQALLLDGRWKAIRLGSRLAPVQLYDLNEDPAEKRDVAPAHLELIERAKKLFVSERSDSAEWPIREQPLVAQAPHPRSTASSSAETSAKSESAAWQNISHALCTKLDAMEYIGKNGKPWNWMRRTQGLAVDPTTGNVFLNITAHEAGLFVSKNHGDTWEKLGDNKITGRGELAGCFSIPYPYTGRMAFFVIDGVGGLTLDGGAHWSRIEKHRRAFDFGDVDWSSSEPKLMFAANHEPFGRCVSTDAGATWTQLDNYSGSNDANKKGRGFRLGVFDSQTLLSAHLDEDGIELSTDMGKTWTKVADYRVLGHRPVHYGKRLYWATTSGIIATDDGRNWKLVGTALPNASCGPYFGQSEVEMMVVTPEGFFVTKDAAKTWRKAADYFSVPDTAIADGYHINGSGRHFAWDPVNDILYACATGGSAFKLQLKP